MQGVGKKITKNLWLVEEPKWGVRKGNTIRLYETKKEARGKGELVEVQIYTPIEVNTLK